MMKFAIYREVEGGGRKFLVEMNQDEILDEVKVWFGTQGVKIFKEKIIEKFKKESIKIP